MIEDDEEEAPKMDTEQVIPGGDQQESVEPVSGFPATKRVSHS